ncbi:MAG: DUF1629 domain-containing protein [Pseudomonadota bacterium]
MTHIFDMQLHKVQIPADMPEWEERYPIPGPLAKAGANIVGGWREGMRKTLPEEMPKELVARKPRKAWPDAFKAVNGLHVVTERAKDVIERFDPNLHQFFPLRLRTKRRVEIEGPWFAMNVTVRQSSIVLEKSRMLVNSNFPDTHCSFYPTSKTEDVIVDPSKLSPDIHFWREARFIGSLAGSDAFVAAFKDAGVKFFPSFRATDLADIEAR